MQFIRSYPFIVTDSFAQHIRAITKDDLPETVRETSESAGVQVTRSTPFQIPAASKAIHEIAESLASSPLEVHIVPLDDPEAESEIDYDHPLNDIFRVEATPEVTAYQFIELIVTHLVTQGNFYGLIEYSAIGDPLEIEPLMPHLMEVVTRDGVRMYRYSRNGVQTIDYSPDEILHIKGLSYDGVCGLNPLVMFEQSFSLALATTKHGARYFKRGGNPDGMLAVADDLTAEEAQKLGDAFDNRVKSGGTPVAGGRTDTGQRAVDYQAITNTNEQSQFLGTRVENNRDMARITKVPLSIVADSETQTFDNVTTEARAFNTRTVGRLARRIEDAINQKFLRPERGLTGRFEYADGQRRFVKFNLSELDVVDPVARMTALREVVGKPYITVNEARDMLDLEAVDDGDELVENMPIQMNFGDNSPTEDNQNGTDDATDEQLEVDRSMAFAGRNGHAI